MSLIAPSLPRCLGRELLVAPCSPPRRDFSSSSMMFRIIRLSVPGRWKLLRALALVVSSLRISNASLSSIGGSPTPSRKYPASTPKTPESATTLSTVGFEMVPSSYARHLILGKNAEAHAGHLGVGVGRACSVVRERIRQSI